RALQLRPNYAEAYCNLGNAYRAAGQLRAAESSYTAALQLAPDSAEVHNNLGSLMRDEHDLFAAQAHFQEAVRLNPQFADAWCNLAVVQSLNHAYDQAAGSYQAAIQLRPQHVPTYLKLGAVLEMEGRYEAAGAAYEQAIAIEPQNPLHALRLTSICPVVFAGRDAIESFRRVALETWRGLRHAAFPAGAAATLVPPPFNMQFVDGNLRALREAYAGIYEGRFAQPQLPPRAARPRIGFVVTYRHERIFLRSLSGVLNRLVLDRADYYLICPQTLVATVRREVRDEIRAMVVPDGFLEMVEAIREQAFDVLYYFEVGSDATNYFLPFLRLAPVQCAAWGLQLTSGIRHVDYYLSSALVEPSDAADHYSEQLLCADTLLTYQTRIPRPEFPRARARFGLSPRENLYVCAQHVGKYHPDFDGLIGGILERDPDGVVVLTGDPHGHAGRRLQARWQQSLPHVASRIRLLPRQSAADYWELIAAADVLLDPPHFGGVNSTYDGLRLGKPIVTLPSPYHRGRYTLGCYHKMNLLDNVVADRNQYVRRAVSLGTERDLRREAEERITAQAEVLFEDNAAVQAHDRLFALLVEEARRRC
ncbi:MAG: tetratricopeptide repeat protein, partial [Pirellulaceae bacterium]